MSRRRIHVTLTLMFASSWCVAVANGCSAAGTKIDVTGTGTGGVGGALSSSTGTAHASSSTGQGGMISFLDSGNAPDAVADVITNPCKSECGPVELCDPAHLGFDDNCNGLVDEGCACTPGSVHWCFEGDPSYRNTPGCYDGTETCSELGIWGPCLGGVQAVPPDNCFVNNVSACHAISAAPYATIQLQSGVGAFDANAVPGSESYTVQCPAGVSQCPAVMLPDSYEALQSGEYTVTYSKSVAGNPNPMSCTFPLFVGAPGLRFELSWEHTTADPGVDLDLHVHQPVNTQPWAVSPGEPQDCTWSSCKFDTIETGLPPAPQWFPTLNMVPQPVNWDLDLVTPSNNTCYNDPRGVGAMWAAFGKGCHNPRQDVDNITCDFSVTNPNDPSFCTPENTNIDYPPDKEWIRVGVHYYWNHNETYAVHPEIKIFCNGALSADLGPQGFYSPTAPVTFDSSDGMGSGTGNRFWIAADVAFSTDACGATTCIVQPIYSDATNLTPLLTLDTAAKALFAPAWPPAPQ